jgi:hypothetical protein
VCFLGFKSNFFFMLLMNCLICSNQPQPTYSFCCIAVVIARDKVYVINVLLPRHARAQGILVENMSNPMIFLLLSCY